MGTRYFRKMGVEPVALSNGQRAQFKSVDGVVSYLATGDSWLASEFEQQMREHRSGITEIDYATFDRDYLVKKNNGQTSNLHYRDELSRGRLMPSALELTARLNEIQGVVGVDSPPPPPSAPAALAQPVINTEIAKALPTVEDYKPVVGKRKRAAK